MPAFTAPFSSRPADCASLFVGDLAPDVTDIILQEYFRQFYPSVRSAKVITDAATGRSKGYGFVRFRWVAGRERTLFGPARPQVRRKRTASSVARVAAQCL